MNILPVFVHGNPETSAIWRPLLAEMGHEDAVLLSPRGFGAPIPAGFTCTVGDYRDWLIESLERLSGPADLVVHELVDCI